MPIIPLPDLGVYIKDGKEIDRNLDKVVINI